MMLSFQKSFLLISLLLSATAFSSCASNQTHLIGANSDSRMIASINDAQPYDDEFQKIVNSNDPGKALQAHLDRSVRLFYRAQSLLNDYDAKIDEFSEDAGDPSRLQTDDTYARLMSAWIMREQARAKIRYFYARLLEMQSLIDVGDASVTPATAAQSQMLEATFKSAFVSANSDSADKLAKQELIEDLLRTNEDFRQNQLKSDRRADGVIAKVNAFDLQLRPQVMSDAKTLKKFFAKNQRQIDRRSNVARADDEINAELETIFPEMKKHIADNFGSRSPQSAGVSPQTGPNGMMNGMNFKTGRWAITFDDGPSGAYTPTALANLNNAGLKATFFWLAQNMSYFKTPAGARTLATAKSQGEVLACHSFSHPQLPKLSAAALHHEIVDAAHTETAFYGQKPAFFRCPYGACGSQTSAVRQMIAANGMISVLWNVDSLDWQDKNPDSVYRRVKRQMAVMKRGIILFHDIHPQSMAASKRLMADFTSGKKTGQYRVLTIQQAKDELNSSSGMR